jgi:hypothetical protein
MNQAVDERTNDQGEQNRPAPEDIGPTAVIPDEEIDAEVQSREEQAEEQSAALDELAEMPPDGAGDEWDDDSGDPEGSVENFVDVFPNPLGAEPPFDPEIFERGSLAAGIRMLEALLTQAKAGYINEQIDELARVLDVDFPDPERFFLGQVAARETTASGLPDVAGAYQALVRAKAQVA